MSWVHVAYSLAVKSPVSYAKCIAYGYLAVCRTSHGSVSVSRKLWNRLITVFDAFCILVSASTIVFFITCYLHVEK